MYESAVIGESTKVLTQVVSCGDRAFFVLQVFGTVSDISPSLLALEQ